jgi:hypothetical protein
VLLCLLVCLELVFRVAVRLLFFRQSVAKPARFQRVALEKLIPLLDEVVLLIERCPSGI